MIRRALPYVLAIVAVIGVLFAVYSFGVHVENARRVAEVTGLKYQHTKALSDATQRERDKEAQHAADMAAVDAKHTKEMRNAKADADHDIAALRAGAIRVRDRFTCPVIPAGGVSQASSSTGLGDATPRGGLQAADAELVLRIAADADEVAVQLAACQAIVRNDRGE